jgi:hypothetical protein
MVLFVREESRERVVYLYSIQEPLYRSGHEDVESTHEGIWRKAICFCKNK